MAYTDYKKLMEQIQNSGQSWSDADLQLAQKDPDAGMSIYSAKSEYQKAQDASGRQAAHDRAEQIRRQYGSYSGGGDGSQFYKDSTFFNFDDDYADQVNAQLDKLLGYGQFTNPYQSDIDDLLGKMKGRDPFSYDAASDPIYQQYQKTYLREGQRAREDTLGNYATVTGGMPSTAAVNAASQAQDYYNSQMADKIPELYKLAYDMYMDEGNDMLNQLSAYRGLSADALNAWNANLGLAQTQYGAATDASDRAYDRAYQKYSADYNANRDIISDNRYADETDYARQTYAEEDAYDRAMQFLSTGVMPSEDMLRAAGIDSGIAQALVNRVLVGKSGKSSDSPRKSTNETSGTQDYDGLFRDAYASGHPENFIATNYKKYGFDTSTGLSSEYKELYDDDFADQVKETIRMVNEAEYSPSATVAYLRAQGYDEDTIQRILDAM